jgi:glyoxylase-like metal-dependent hydrolase (beta-lactamase superfamily II)
MKITNNLYVLVDKVARAYLIDTPQGIALIDTGLPGNERKIERFVHKIGKTMKDIKYILITHSDSDHYGALRALQKKTDAKTVASDLEAKAIRKGTSSRQINPKGIVKMFYSLMINAFRAKPARVDVSIRPNDRIPFWGGINVLSSAGHTPGHLSFFARSHSVLFAGDSILIHRGKLVPASGANTWDSEMAIKSFEQQLILKPKFICGGHGWKVNG